MLAQAGRPSGLAISGGFAGLGGGGGVATNARGGDYSDIIGDPIGREGLMVELARGCDVPIHMNHYLSGREPTPSYRLACGNHRDNAQITRRAGVGTLVLTHVLPHIDRPGIREQVIHEVKQEFAGNVNWGEDLMQLDRSRLRARKT